MWLNTQLDSTPINQNAKTDWPLITLCSSLEQGLIYLSPYSLHELRMKPKENYRKTLAIEREKNVY